MGPEGEVSHGQTMLHQPILVFHACLYIQYCIVGVHFVSKCSSCSLSASLLFPNEVANTHK